MEGHFIFLKDYNDGFLIKWSLQLFLEDSLGIPDGLVDFIFGCRAESSFLKTFIMDVST